MYRKVNFFGKSNFYLLILCCTFCKFIFCQTYVVTRYADDSGLPSRIVRDVIQDQQGFIWVGGNNGLYKFDGQSFKPFHASLKDTVGLRDNKIISLYEAKDGKLWIGTPKGLHFMENDEIFHFPLKNSSLDTEEYILNIFGDREGNIWISTYGGLFFLDGSNEPVQFLGDNNDQIISKGTVWSVNQDAQGTIWASTNDGLFTRNKDNPYVFDRVPLEFHEPIDTSSFIGYYNIQQFNDSLFILDTNLGPLKGIFRKESLHISYFENAQGKFEKGYAATSTIDNKGSVWFATWKHGIKKFKIEDGYLLQEEIHSKNGFFDISGTSHDVFEDIQGNIWIADSNGLFKLSEDESNVTTFPPYDCPVDFTGIYSIKEDRWQNMWITTPSKLYRLTKQDVLNNQCPTELLDFTEQGMEQARDMLIDREDRLWLGADGGLFVTQLYSNQNPGPVIRYTTKEGLPHDISFEIFQKDKNAFWVGNYHGLLKMELLEGNIRAPKFTTYAHDEDRPGSLVNTQAMSMETDNKGNLWIGTFSGVSRMVADSDGGNFKNYLSSFGDFESLSNNSIKTIFRDHQERLWIATQRGLNLYEPKSDTFLQFGHAEGLPSEYILGIAQDSKDYFWICTTNGVLKAKYDEESASFIETVHYTSNDGLADNIPYRNAIHIDGNDNVFIGSRDGISIIRDDIPSTSVAQESLLTITDIQVNQKREIGFKSIFGQLKDSSLLLKHNSNSLKINYAILDYINPENNTYRHKLLPVNDAWVETDGLSELTYYNLPPDNYTLILDAANNRGQWSNGPIELSIVITPPFWQTNWAISVYVLAMAFTIWRLYRIRIGKKMKELERKMAMEAAIVNEREQLRKENAADFHDELGSMLTKISMFLTMAERNLEGNEDPKPFFYKIRENTKGLSSGFRDLLWVIDPQKDSLADTFLRIKAFGEELFEQSEVDFTTSEFQEVFTQRMLNPKTKKQVVMIFGLWI